MCMRVRARVSDLPGGLDRAIQRDTVNVRQEKHLTMVVLFVCVRAWPKGVRDVAQFLLLENGLECLGRRGPCCIIALQAEFVEASGDFDVQCTFERVCRRCSAHGGALAESVRISIQRRDRCVAYLMLPVTV